jgi:hypothetical protein
MRDYDLADIQVSGATGIDALLKHEPRLVKASGRMRVASCKDLTAFTRVSEDTLVHKSDRELWTLRKEADGFVIERLFDDNGGPLKG